MIASHSPGTPHNAVDSTNLKGVSVCLTDFMGHLENPISGVCAISDSVGYFSLVMCQGFKEVKRKSGLSGFILIN